MSTRPDLRDVARDDERRRRDEAKTIAQQQQIDELRSLVRELVSRQSRNEEQFKQYELALSQVRQTGDQHRHEVQQSLQARQLEDTRVRQQLTDLDARIDETSRPIRSLQAHISEIVETQRRGRDDSDDEVRRYDELKTVIEHVAAIAERNAGVIQIARESIESLRTDHEQTRRELQQAEDSVKIVEQDARRRVAELIQDLQNLGVRVDEYKAIFVQLDARIEDVRHSIVHIDPALDDLAQVDARIQEEILRFYTQSDERDELLSERIDELRRQLDAQVRDLRQISEERYERVNARVDTLIDVDRELAYRLNVIDLRIDEVRELATKLRRELWHLHEIRARMRLDQAQAELESISDARRITEQEIAADRPERSERSTQSPTASNGATP